MCLEEIEEGKLPAVHIRERRLYVVKGVAAFEEVPVLGPKGHHDLIARVRFARRL